MVARKVSLVTGKGSPGGKRSGRGKSQVVSMTGVTNKNVAKKKLVVGGPSTTKRRVAIATSKSPIKINNKTSINGNGRKVVMNALYPGSRKGSTKSNAAVQLYVNTNTTKKQNGGGNVAKKPLQNLIKNDKVKGAAAGQARGGVGGKGNVMMSMLKTKKHAAMGTSSNNNSSSNNNTYNTGSKNATAMATARLIVSAGSHPKNADIKQLLGAYEKGWVADNTFALELQKLLV